MCRRADRSPRLLRLWATLLAAALTVPSVVTAQEPCRQALALALDVSGSVDAREYRLQIDGIVAALGTAPVRRALLNLPEQPVHLLIYEWSGTEDQHLVLDWTAIRSPADLEIVRETLRQTLRRGTAPGTAVGSALQVGHRHLARRAACQRRTLDISGDGKANLGPAPETARDALRADGITVNALVIGADAPDLGDVRQVEIGELSAYFRARVITGPDAFVQTALGYDAYAEAMARKLERELRAPVISSLPAVPHPFRVLARVDRHQHTAEPRAQ